MFLQQTHVSNRSPGERYQYTVEVHKSLAEKCSEVYCDDVDRVVKAGLRPHKEVAPVNRTGR